MLDRLKQETLAIGPAIYRNLVSNGEMYVEGKVMSNDNIFERLWKLQTQVSKLVLDRKRNPDIVAGVLQAIVDEPQAQLPSDASFGHPFVLNVDYDSTFDELVKSGSYAWIDSNLSAAYFVRRQSGTAKRIVEFRTFDHVPSSEELDNEFKQSGLYAAGYEELLALGKVHPQMQHEHRIVAQGAMVAPNNGAMQGLPHALCLVSNLSLGHGRIAHGRGVALQWTGFLHGARTRYMGVRFPKH